MGRYITKNTSTAIVTSGDVAPGTIVGNAPLECYGYANGVQIPCFKYNYDSNEIWPNRITVDTPGTYSFTVPAGVTCMRTVVVGGGGKPKGEGANPSYAGAGGGLAEKYWTVTPGQTMCITVGRQEGNSTAVYNATTVTATGAVGLTRGCGVGGDWNSKGGCAGLACGCYYCGVCVCCSLITCCGYCVVTARKTDWCHGEYDYCNPRYSGGGSAGSPFYCCGGDGQGAWHNTRNNNTGGTSAGGGGGIGSISRQVVQSACCSCICSQNDYQGPWSYAPASAGGGGGTKLIRPDIHPADGWACHTWYGLCNHGWWIEPAGLPGGLDNQEAIGGTAFWECWPCACLQAKWGFQEAGPGPRKWYWHDVYAMRGTGSAAKSIGGIGNCSSELGWGGTNMKTKSGGAAYALNAGEGAGTGGTTYECCCSYEFSIPCVPFFINWQQVCCLGVRGTAGVAMARDQVQSLIPSIVSCAGTLGGSGGMGISGITSKAGPGGGGGQSRCHILCICWGGNYDYCNGNPANPLLAFPPCCLDFLASNAGGGLALIYWK